MMIGISELQTALGRLKTKKIRTIYDDSENHINHLSPYDSNKSNINISEDNLTEFITYSKSLHPQVNACKFV